MRSDLTVHGLEIELCAEVYNNWQNSINETEDEYCRRKHGYDLSELVGLIIEEKLSEREKQIVKLFWYQCIPKKEIAEIENISLPTVYKILKTVEDKIFSYLEYVVIYQDSMLSRKLIPVAVKEALCNAIEKKCKALTVGQRLSQLRKQENLKAETVEKALKLEKGKLEKYENDKVLPKLEVLKNFVVFYDTTADFILFGKKG